MTLTTAIAVLIVLIIVVGLWCVVPRTDRLRAPMTEDYGEPVINRGQFANALNDPTRPPYDDPGAKL
jgi:hypothetical protein